MNLFIYVGIILFVSSFVISVFKVNEQVKKDYMTYTVLIGKCHNAGIISAEMGIAFVENLRPYREVKNKFWKRGRSHYFKNQELYEKSMLVIENYAQNNF